MCHEDRESGLSRVPRVDTSPVDGGVPRDIGIVNLTLTLALVFGMRRVMGIVLGVVLHGVLVFFTKRDPQFFDVFRRALRQRDHYDV